MCGVCVRESKCVRSKCVCVRARESVCVWRERESVCVCERESVGVRERVGVCVVCVCE